MPKILQIDQSSRIAIIAVAVVSKPLGFKLPADLQKDRTFTSIQ